MNNYFIILASGQSKRFNSKKPKQYNIYQGKPLFRHSLDKAIKSKLGLFSYDYCNSRDPSYISNNYDRHDSAPKK